MKTYIAVFKSKTEVFAFRDLLLNFGAAADIASTPKEAHLGCGLSVKFPPNAFGVAVKILREYDFRSFYGFYSVEKNGVRTTTVRFNRQ